MQKFQNNLSYEFTQNPSQQFEFLNFTLNINFIFVDPFWCDRLFSWG
jgi:hypothetical protein